MWICKSCGMENEDKDSLCYMCGTKRPHNAPVRLSVQQDAPQSTSASSEPLPAEENTVLFDGTQTVRTDVSDFDFGWDDDGQPDGTEVIISDFIESIADEPADSAPAVTAPSQADVNLFASVFNASTQSAPTPPQAAQRRQDTPQADFASVFSDFLTAIETPPPVVPDAPAMQPAAQPVAPLPVQPPAENSPLSKKEKKQKQREDSRKTVTVRVCSFLRTLFVAALCLWLAGFCLAAVMRLASASAGDIRLVFEDLLYAFQQRLQDVFEYGLPGFFGDLLIATGLL